MKQIGFVSSTALVGVLRGDANAMNSHDVLWCRSGAGTDPVPVITRKAAIDQSWDGWSFWASIVVKHIRKQLDGVG
jgi:hypothetical protein